MGEIYLPYRDVEENIIAQNRRSFYQQNVDFLNPVSISKDAVKTGLLASMFHAGSLTNLDVLTSLSAGIATHIGCNLGKVYPNYSYLKGLREENPTLNEEEQREVSSKLEDLCKNALGVKDTLQRGALGLIGVVGYDVSQADNLSQAFSNGMIHTGVTIGALYTSFLATSYFKNKNNNL